MVKPLQSADRSIPGSLVANDGQHDLGPEGQARVDPASKATKESDLPCVEEWIRPREGSDPDIQPDYGTDARELLHTHA